MDCFTWRVTFNKDIKFSNWPQMEKYLKDSLTSVGVISKFQQLILDIKDI